MAKPKIKNTITKKEWNKKHKDFKLMGKDGIPYIMAYDDKIGTHLVPVKIIEATDAEEKEFHTKLDTLVHNTFGKSPEEMEESVGAELDLIKQSSKDVKDFLKNVFKDSDFRAMKSDKDFIKYLKSIYEGVSVNESIFSFKTDNIEQLHFETNPKKAELMKIELGKMQGEINKRKQIESGEYSLRLFRKKIKYGNGKDVGVFLPGSYDASTSKLGDGPHKKAVKKVNWNQKKYDQWLEDMASNGGAKNAFDMAQNAKNEPGLIDWVKKNFRGDKPLQRIQWDIEGFSESVVTEAKEPEVITQLRKIVKDKQNALVVDTKSKKKVRVDMQSASLMVQVYDALKQQSNKDKFVKSGIVMMGHMAYKLMKNEGVNEGDGLWANIRAKKARGEKPAHKNSKAYKDAVKAGKKINKNEEVNEAKAFVVMFKVKKDLPNRNIKPSSAAYSKEVDAKKFLKSVENDGGKGMIVKSNVSGMKVEAKDAEVYHKSYTHAIEAAEAYALKKGYTIEDDEMFTKVGMNSKRPSVGKTTKVNLELLRNGKPQKKMLHIQVYGMKNGYELNAYIN